jgi:L-ascorbate metabolism protein UlaG (beta-lactamase superfamily)
VVEPSSRLAEQRVGLRYFGHSAFLWSTPSGVRVLIDPFGNAGEPLGSPSFGFSVANRPD